MRGYKEKLSVNSFPCEIFSIEEAETYREYFGKDRNALIIESLEYPRFDLKKSLKKRDVAALGDNEIALDDYGVGFNDLDMVKIMEPRAYIGSSMKPVCFISPNLHRMAKRPYMY